MQADKEKLFFGCLLFLLAGIFVATAGGTARYRMEKCEAQRKTKQKHHFAA